MKQKPAKDAEIKARCSHELKRSIEQLARFQQLDASDIIRIACAQYISQCQRRPLTVMDHANDKG